jgi:SOS-response transcriptional repressor LexA
MADTVRPTKKQRELLTFIEQFINQHGYSPSYREIMAGLNYTSVATVALHVNNLISRGHLRKRDHSARSLEVVKGGTADQEVEASTTAAALTPGKEQWFVEQVEAIFDKATAAEHVTQEHIDQLLVLTGALQILGLDETASGFMTRLDDLKSRL